MSATRGPVHLVVLDENHQRCTRFDGSGRFGGQRAGDLDSTRIDQLDGVLT